MLSGQILHFRFAWAEVVANTQGVRRRLGRIVEAVTSTVIVRIAVLSMSEKLLVDRKPSIIG